MSAADAFEPPTDALAVRPRNTGSVLGAWMGSGAAMGLALGTAIQLVRPDGVDAPRLATILGLGVPALMLGAGVLAIRVERGLAAARPAVADARGDLGRPLHAALWAVPFALALPASALLVLVLVLATRSWVPAALFGVGALGLAWGARRLWASHRLTSALQDLERGEIGPARASLEALEAGWLTPRAARVGARLNLGLLDLADGRLDAAAGWYARVPDGPGAALAQAGLALVRVLQDRPDDANHALLAAMSDPGAASAESQIDAVRVLLVGRTDGASAALALGEQLLHGDSGPLLHGVLAHARLACGDPDGAHALLEHGVRQALEESGWDAVIPEVRSALA